MLARRLLWRTGYKLATYSAVGSVGIDTHVMPLPIPFVEDAVSQKLTTRKQVFEHHREILNPPVKGCEV